MQGTSGIQYSDEMRDLVRKIRTNIKKHDVLFKLAGEHLDQVFSMEAVVEDWEKDPDKEAERLERIGECFARATKATSHYLKNPPDYDSMSEDDRLLAARVILLLTWIHTDRDAESFKTGLTGLQYWPWEVECLEPKEGKSASLQDENYNRALARQVLFGFKGAEWEERVKKAWEAQEEDLLEHKTEVNQSQKAKGTCRTRYKSLVKPIENLVRKQGGYPISHSKLEREFKADRKTIKRAIEESDYLRKVYKDYPRPRQVRSSPMSDAIIESQAQSTELSPEENAIAQEEIERLICEQNKDARRDGISLNRQNTD